MYKGSISDSCWHLKALAGLLSSLVVVLSKGQVCFLVKTDQLYCVSFVTTLNNLKYLHKICALIYHSISRSTSLVISSVVCYTPLAINPIDSPRNRPLLFSWSILWFIKGENKSIKWYCLCRTIWGCGRRVPIFRKSKEAVSVRQRDTGDCCI